MDSRGSLTEQGYEVEVAFPFKSFRFEPPESGEEAIFGIGLKRNVPRKNEEMIWPFVSNDSSWYRPAELGALRGLRNIRPGRSLEFRSTTRTPGGFRRTSGSTGYSGPDRTSSSSTTSSTTGAPFSACGTDRSR